MRRTCQYLLFGAAVLFLGLFLLLPVWTVIETGFNFSLMAEICRNKIYMEGLFNSFKIAAVTTTGVFIISLLLALIYDKFDFKGKDSSRANS